MKRLFFSLMLLLSALATVQAQTTNSVFLTLGGTYTSFQDVKFSKVSYNGGGAVFNLGFEKENPRALWGTGLYVNASSQSPATHDAGSVLALNPKIYFKYLRKVNDRFSIGAHWDILGMHYRNISGLKNNGNYYVTSSDLLVATNYKHNKFDFGLDLGVLSFVKEGTGFSFSSPQNGLEDGDFDYQNEALEDPFGFKYFELRNTFNHLILRTKIDYHLNERFTVGYQWSARHFSEVDNYPVTIGAHSVTIRWNFIHKTKDKVELK